MLSTGGRKMLFQIKEMANMLLPFFHWPVRYNLSIQFHSEASNSQPWLHFGITWEVLKKTGAQSGHSDLV